MKFLTSLLLITISVSLCSCSSIENKKQQALTLDEIRIRDPYILADKNTKTYYMYAQMGNRLNVENRQKGVEAYTSKDLKKWYGPEPVFIMDENFWGQKAVWAPEVHEYKDKYYLFVTLTSEKELAQKENRPKIQLRGTSILVADSPAGPFKPFANKPHTPEDWMALDGTLWEEDGKPWMIFCHEWIQVTDGTMEAVQLTDDLSGTIGEPVTLFTATSAPWVRNLGKVGSKYKEKVWDGYVTDGPFLYRTKTGRLLMIWSSFGEEKYAVGMAFSKSGKVAGPWVQIPEPLFKANGGHGMLFINFDGQLMLALHQPNSGPLERAKLFKLQDAGGRLILSKE